MGNAFRASTTRDSPMTSVSHPILLGIDAGAPQSLLTTTESRENAQSARGRARFSIRPAEARRLGEYEYEPSDQVSRGDQEAGSPARNPRPNMSQRPPPISAMIEPSQTQTAGKPAVSNSPLMTDAQMGP
jgi:hypothetical protein